jgi:hypothetical protein
LEDVGLHEGSSQLRAIARSAGLLVALMLAGVAAGVGWQTYTASDALPVPRSLAERLQQPSVSVGPGWTFEASVSNLQALVLVLGVEHTPETPGTVVHILDAWTGDRVALLSFPETDDVYLRLSPSRSQLLASYRTPDDPFYHLTVWSLIDSPPHAMHSMVLPDRTGYATFSDQFVLSRNERFAYYPKRTTAQTSECPRALAVICDRRAVGVVDLDNFSEVQNLAVPGQCYLVQINTYEEDAAAASCGDTTTFLGPLGYIGQPQVLATGRMIIFEPAPVSRTACFLVHHAASTSAVYSLSYSTGLRLLIEV